MEQQTVDVDDIWNFVGQNFSTHKRWWTEIGKASMLFWLGWVRLKISGTGEAW